MVEVFIPSDELNKGVALAWATLFALAVGLVAASVWVGDRLAHKVVGAAKSFAQAARSLNDGQLGVRVQPGGPLELMEAGDLSRTVAAAVRSLPEEQREVIVLKEYQDLTFLEIAEALDVPVSTVKTRLYRGLTQLKQRLVRQGIRSATPIPAPTH